MNPLIRVAGVWFHYQSEVAPPEHWILRDINLSIDAGEYISIVGSNGSGKSTLARLLNGILLPTKGEVWVDGRNTYSEQEIWQIRRDVGMIFQNPDNQIVATSVQDDVAFGLENLGIPRLEMVERIQTSLKQVGLLGYEKSEPHHLSGGQKQRLAIAGILAMQPKVIVFDEATSMLDPQGRIEVLRLMRKLHQSGTTVIHITHSAREAFLAERVVVIDQGELRLDMPTRDLFPQSHLLKQWGLQVPLSIDLYQRLIAKGWPLRAEISSTEDLVNEIWRFLSKV